MNIESILAIIITFVLVYFLVRFVLKPIVKALLAIIIFLLLIYIIQYFFGFNINRFLGHFSIYLDITKWGIDLSWILNPLNEILNKIANFFK